MSPNGKQQIFGSAVEVRVRLRLFLGEGSGLGNFKAMYNHGGG